MEKTQITTLLNSGCKTLNKILKAECLPADLKIEISNMHDDMLTLICKIEENVTKKLTSATINC